MGFRVKDKLAVARWFKRGWERAMESRGDSWDSLPKERREYMVNRWTHSMISEILSEEN